VEAAENQPLMLKHALDYLQKRAQAGGPFFLFLPLGIPHEPVVPTAEFLGKSGAKDSVRGNLKYGDWILQGDAALGQVMDALDRLGLASNTLLIATSDNGAEQRPYPPLRESKRSIYEGGHRVPFVARWPGKIKPGSVNNNAICLNDLMATAAEIAGAKLPNNAAEDSVSLLAALLGTAKGPVREATVHQSMAGDLAIRQGQWKLVFLRSGKKELYNLRDDLRETNDLAPARPEMVEQLTQLMQRYVVTGRSTPGAPQKNEAPVSLSGSPARKRKAASPN
jgi:arylsulfatase A-like enzyme